MNLYSIGATINTTNLMDEINVVVLAASREIAEAYLKNNYSIKKFRYSKRLKHGAYIVASTFINPDENN